MTLMPFALRRVERPRAAVPALLPALSAAAVRHPVHRLAAGGLVMLALLMVAAPGRAQITVTEAWVRGTVPGMKATGAFMRIESRADTRLVAAASPAAPLVEIHEMAMVDNVMRMRAIPGLAVPAGRPVELRPGGYHVMLMDLPRPIERGTTVPITLTFQSGDGRRETVKVAAEVRPLASGAPPAAAGGHTHR